ncbi:MAG: hypothetical protein AAF943_02270 [Pseudomonadota bacterium]
MRLGRGVLLALLVLACFLTVYRGNPLNAQAQRYAQSIATTAAATYVTLRSLNAFLSTAQEVEVGVAFIAQGTAQPLKVLEPIDDTVERIASLIFAVMVATGVLAVSLGPVSSIGWALFAVAMALALIQRRGTATNFLALYGVFFGLGLPFALVLSSTLSAVLTEATYQENLTTLQDITRAVDGADVLQEAGPGLAEYRALAASVWSRADELISALIAILSVYVFRIFVMPLLLVGGLFLLIRRLALADPFRSG